MNFKLKTILHFLVAGLTPYIIAMSIIGYSVQSEYKQRAQKDMEFSLHLVADRIDANLESIKKDFLFISKLEVMNDIIAKDIDRRIGELLESKKKDLGIVGDYYVTDTEQNIIASSTPSFVGKKLMGDMLFKTDIISTLTMQKIGVLYLDYKPENLKAFMGDDTKKIFFVKLGNITYFDKPLSSEFIESSIKLKSLQNSSLYLKIDKNEALKILNDIKILLLLSLLIGAVLIVSASIFFASKIIKPISELSSVANDISKSEDYTKRVAYDSKDEIGVLARSFNKLVESVDEALKKLKLESENKIKLIEEQGKNEMLETLSKKLSRYLSPQIYQSIFEGKQDAKLETKRKKLTIFFSDIVNFTETTDMMESEELASILNRYLQEMSDIALSCGATIDKYIGDAIVAFFGDPESKGAKEDAVACVDMALKMLTKLKTLQKEWVAMGISKPFNIRIGINTDYCTVGNIGTDRRMDYTIIGGAVNLASRVESVCEENSVFITEETYLLVRDVFECEEKGEVSLKGIGRPIKTYEVMATKEPSKTIVYVKDGVEIEINGEDIKDSAKVAKALGELAEQLKK